jgi:16S rRNA (cytosine967-C5)-methyltransferase
MNPARRAATHLLLTIEQGQTTLARELERARRSVPEERDRALLVELTAGTLRWRNALDAMLGACSQRPLSELSPAVRANLRVGAYQLLRRDRVPDHAVVNDAVESARLFGAARAAGFVNAVLRAIIRRRRNLPLPVRPSPDADLAAQTAYLTVTLSHPGWLVTRWLTRYGFDATASWCEFNNRAPDVTVRPVGDGDLETILSELTVEGAEAARARWVRSAVTLPPGALGRLSPALRARLFVQDEASQIVALAVGAAPGDRVLDVCAAPGGKTMVMAGTMAGRGLLVASDNRLSRVRLLRSLTSRAPTPIHVVALDALAPLPFVARFDRVLLDAPCSGLGTIRRDPDLKWSREEEDLGRLSAHQRRLLDRASQVVRPGGVLVYATCSSEPEENDAVVDAFLASSPDFTLTPAVPGPDVAGGAALVSERGFLRTLPFRDGLDAFFAAVLVRRRAA